MTSTPDPGADRDTWWRHAVVYQVYPRSFADLDGDGLGDIPGLISRLDYLADLGVDAVWISPFYTSPLNDGGYDVADYRSIDARLGSMDDVDALIAQAHARNIRILMDIVPNHSSSEHPWFQELLAAEPGSPAWDRYVVREGKGPDRESPPNNWRSVFHGAGWSRIRTPQGEPTGYWYLHLFDTTQPDLNWENPEVRAEFRDILRFWFDRGIDGFRIDVAHGLVKEEGLPDFEYPETADGEEPDVTPAMFGDDAAHSPFWDQDGVHDIYREWRCGGRRVRPAAHLLRRDVGPESGAARPLPARRRAADVVQLHLLRGRLGRPEDAQRPSTRPSPTTPRSGRRPRGCCRTTTSSDTGPGWRRSSTVPRTSSVVCAEPARRPSSRCPCPGRCTCTRARSSAFPR